MVEGIGQPKTLVEVLLRLIRLGRYRVVQTAELVIEWRRGRGLGSWHSRRVMVLLRVQVAWNCQPEHNTSDGPADSGLDVVEHERTPSVAQRESCVSVSFRNPGLPCSCRLGDIGVGPCKLGLSREPVTPIEGSGVSLVDVCGGQSVSFAASWRYPGHHGAVAQLGERCNRTAEVRGSIPLSSMT